MDSGRDDDVKVTVSIEFADEKLVSHSEEKMSDYARRCLGPPEISNSGKIMRFGSTSVMAFAAYGEFQRLGALIHPVFSYVLGGAGALLVGIAGSQGLTTSFRESSENSVGMRERYHNKKVKKKLPRDDEKLERQLFQLDGQFQPADYAANAKPSRVERCTELAKEYAYVQLYPNLTLFERAGQWAATAFAIGAGYTETQEFLMFLFGHTPVSIPIAIFASIIAGMSCYNVVGIEFEYNSAPKSERDNYKQEVKQALLEFESRALRREQRIKILEGVEDKEEKPYQLFNSINAEATAPDIVLDLSTVTPSPPVELGWCARLIDKTLGLFPQLPSRYRIIQLACTFFVTASVASKTTARVREWGDDSDVSKGFSIPLAMITAGIMMYVCYRTTGVNYTRHTIEGPEIEEQGLRLAKLTEVNKSQEKRIEALLAEKKVRISWSDLPQVEEPEPLSCSKRFINTCSRLCSWSFFRKKPTDAERIQQQQSDIELGLRPV